MYIKDKETTTTKAIFKSEYRGITERIKLTIKVSSTKNNFVLKRKK